MTVVIVHCGRRIALPSSTGSERSVLAGMAMASLVLFAPLSFAAPSCAFNSTAPVAFGNYDVFAASANSNGVGSLKITCQGGGPSSFVVRLSTGQSLSYASRVMKSGTNSLNYNLYTTSGRTVVWGDGTGGSGTRTVARNSTRTLDIFGRIPAGQDVAAGTYVDSITASINF